MSEQFIRRIISRRRLDPTSPEATGRMIVAGRRALEVFTEQPLTWPPGDNPAPWLILTSDAGGCYHYVGCPPEDGLSHSVMQWLRSVGQVHLLYDAVPLYTGPATWETCYDDPLVLCHSCGARPRASQLLTDESGPDEETCWSERVCPHCGEWDCCSLRLESHPEFEARHRLDQLLLQTAGDPLAPSAAWETVDTYSLERREEAERRLAMLHQESSQSWRLVRATLVLEDGP